MATGSNVTYISDQYVTFRLCAQTLSDSLLNLTLCHFHILLTTLSIFASVFRLTRGDSFIQMQQRCRRQVQEVRNREMRLRA